MFYLIKYEGEFIPPPTYRHCSSVFGENLYIFGGVDQFNSKYNELFEFNLSKKMWKMNCLGGVYPAKRTYHQMIEYNNSIFIFGIIIL